MKKNTHPESHDISVRCACGNAFKTKSTSKDLRVTLCSGCHPFFTGTQKFVDTAGRIEKFEKKYKKAAEKAASAKEEKATKAEKTEKATKAKKAKK